jgi:hypothetical protein
MGESGMKMVAMARMLGSGRMVVVCAGGRRKAWNAGGCGRYRGNRQRDGRVVGRRLQNGVFSCTKILCFFQIDGFHTNVTRIKNQVCNNNILKNN